MLLEESLFGADIKGCVSLGLISFQSLAIIKVEDDGSYVQLSEVSHSVIYFIHQFSILFVSLPFSSLNTGWGWGRCVCMC